MGSHILNPEEYEILLEANDGITAGALGTYNGVVILDPEMSDELLNEGRARDTVRAIQEARKNQNLIVTDRIAVSINAPEVVQNAIQEHLSYIAEQVLATSIVFDAHGQNSLIHDGNVDGELITLSIDVTDIQ